MAIISVVLYLLSFFNNSLYNTESIIELTFGVHGICQTEASSE